jgi:hypothetical protein
MMAHLVRASLIVAIIIGATFLPYVAGGYDPLAKPLSMMAWALGRCGLLYVPVALLWLGASATGMQRRGWLVWLTLAACVLIELVMGLIAFSSGVLFATGFGVIAVLLNIRMLRQLRAAMSEPRVARIIPAILVITPVVVLVIQSALVGPLAASSRNRVITNSAPLIAEIERYRERHGVYPDSLFSLYGDYKPAIIGVQRYHYEQSGEAYNVIFEEPSLSFGTRRFVVYNPRGEQRLTVHEQDRLLLEGPELDADNAGYTLVEQLPQPNWKAFLFLS